MTFARPADRRNCGPNSSPGGLIRIWVSSYETPAACSRRREEADPFPRWMHPPPHVGGYDGHIQANPVARSKVAEPFRARTTLDRGEPPAHWV